MGFLLFGGTVMAFLLRKVGRSSARREYPKLASELGLTFEPPENPRYVGRLVGEMDGFRVRIESDERARIVCYFADDPGIDVRTYVHYRRLPEGYQAFSFGNRADDEWLKTRLESVDRWPEVDKKRLGALLSTLKPHRDRLKAFTLDRERVECVFDFGAPPYLPGSVVRQVLPQLIALLTLLQGASFRDSAQRGALA